MSRDLWQLEGPHAAGRQIGEGQAVGVFVETASSSLVQPELMMFPVKAVNEYPLSRQTADALGEVEAEDGLFYHVKGDRPGHFICASEWICTNVAEEVGIGAPPRALIEMLDGRLVFGSRRISGVADEATTTLFLTTPSHEGTQPASTGLRRLLSRIYAFDLFINNVDRHFGNYLSVEEFSVRRLYAMDNSRALFFGWPIDGFPQPHEHTRVRGLYLRQLHGFDEAAALSVIEKLRRLAPTVIEGFIKRMPPSWLPPELRRELMDWWSNGGRIGRLIELDAGLRDGRLL